MKCYKDPAVLTAVLFFLLQAQLGGSHGGCVAPGRFAPCPSAEVDRRHQHRRAPSESEAEDWVLCLGGSPQGAGLLHP